jgi:hypothetical protein
MTRRTALILTVLLLNFASANAQFSVRLQTGISYIEHFSAGMTFSFSDKHDLSVLYGSDFFFNQRDFLNILLQYNYNLTGLNFAGFTPAIGIKGGYAIYSNKYYRWELTEIIPFARFKYQLKEKIELFLDAGVAVSIEHSMERISYGEIGMYRQYLPELKLGLNFRL